MHQQSDKENPSSDTRNTEAVEGPDLDIDLDADVYTPLSLPTFLSSFTADAADDEESMGTLAFSLRDFGDGEAGLEHGASTVSQTQEIVERSYYEETLYNLLATLPEEGGGHPTSVATSGVSSAALGRDTSDASDAPADAMMVSSLGSVMGNADRAMEQGSAVPAMPRSPAETQADVATRIAHLIRIVASVASRNIRPDDAHYVPSDTTGYDSRYLLAAAYTILTTWGSDSAHTKLSKGAFSQLAGNASMNNFTIWAAHFRDDLNPVQRSEAMTLWKSLGIGDWRDAKAVLDRLKSLLREGAPAPTLQDFIDSPLCRKLSLTRMSERMRSRRSRAKRLWQDATLGNPTPLEVHRPLPVVTRRTGAHRGTAVAAIGADFSGTGNRSQSAQPEDQAAIGIARLIRIVGSIASRELEPDLSHRPLSGQTEYDPRDLLVAAYKVFAESGHGSGNRRIFPMSTFGGLAGGIAAKRFSVWNERYDARKTGPTAFWESLGFGDWIDVGATIRALEAIQDSPDWAPTLQDLEASPLYGKLRLWPKSVSRAQAPRIGNLLAAFPARREGAQSAVTTSLRRGPRRGREPEVDAARADAGPEADASTSRSTNTGTNTGTNTSTNTSTNTGTRRHALDAALGPAVAETSSLRVPAETRHDAARRIARLIRIVAGVAGRELRPGDAHQPPRGSTEYDSRYLLAAAYNVLTTWGADSGHIHLPRGRFSKLALDIPGNSFTVWTRHFQGKMDAKRRREAIAFWENAGLRGWRDAAAVIAELKSMAGDAAPAPTVQDLIDSPLYRRLALTSQSAYLRTKRSRANRAQQHSRPDEMSAPALVPTSTPHETIPPALVRASTRDRTSSARAPFRSEPSPDAIGTTAMLSRDDSLAMRSVRMPEWPVDEVPPGAYAVSYDASGASTQSRPDAPSWTADDHDAGVDWSRVLAPWSQTAVATEVHDTNRGASESWSDAAPGSMHSGMTTLTPLIANSAEPPSMDLSDWSVDDLAAPRIPTVVDVSDSDVSRYADSVVPQPESDASTYLATSTAFDATSRQCTTDGSASDYAPSTASHSTLSSAGTLPSITTLASQGTVGAAMPPPMAVPPGTFVFEHGLTRITGGVGVDMAAVMEMVHAALAARPPSSARAE